MIRFTGLELSRGGRTLLTGVDAIIERGERIGLLGRNGCGKTTLLSAIAGDLSPDRGSIDLPRLRIARLSQHPPAGSHSLLDHVLRADQRRETIVRELADLEAASPESGEDVQSQAQGRRIAQLHSDFDEIDGWTAPARAARLLDGLGFSAGDHGKPVDSLSGGWKMRLDLARVLMTPADLLLLDEPTNHLDLDAVFWLERWLLRFDGTVVVVSHDRDFVDAFATAVLNVEHQQLQRYAGGWSAFERQQAERQRLQRKLADSQAQRIAKLEQFVARFRAQATKAKQAQSRVKALERLERIVLVEDEAAATMRFDSPDQMPEQIASLVHVDCGYAGSPQPSQPDQDIRLRSEDPAEPIQAGGAITIVRRVHLDLRRGDRIGVLGRNGAGKSTLVRTLVGELDVLQGDRTHARALRIGYFAQRQVESLDPYASALEHLKRIAPTEREQVLREFLAGFGFRGEQAIVAVEPFSGGEKARLALALIAWTRPQLLVLDEPTNHLDSSARDALTAALADYEGALLLVSHDRGLLRATVDRFVIVADRRMSPFDGDLEDYRDWLATQNRSTDGVSASGPGSIQGLASASASASSGQPGQHPVTAAHPEGIAAGPVVLPPIADRREERRQAATARDNLQRQRKPLQTRLNRLEAELGRLQREIDTLDTQMADAEFLKSGIRVVAAQRARAELTRQLEQTEEDWLMLTTEFEALSAQ